MLQNLWSAHEEAMFLCEEEVLLQYVYFLQRDLNFIKEVWSYDLIAKLKYEFLAGFFEENFSL